MNRVGSDEWGQIVGGVLSTAESRGKGRSVGGRADERVGGSEQVFFQAKHEKGIKYAVRWYNWVGSQHVNRRRVTLTGRNMVWGERERDELVF